MQNQREEMFILGVFISALEPVVSLNMSYSLPVFSFMYVCVCVCVCVCMRPHCVSHSAAHSLVEETGKKKPFSNAGKGHNLDED